MLLLASICLRFGELAALKVLTSSAEIGVSTSCLKCTHAWTDKHHRITFILKKTLKCVDSQAGSESSFFWRFLIIFPVEFILDWKRVGAASLVVVRSLYATHRKSLQQTEAVWWKLSAAEDLITKINHKMNPGLFEHHRLMIINCRSIQEKIASVTYLHSH